MQFTKSPIPRQNRRRAWPSLDPQPHADGPLAGRHVLVVVERTPRTSGQPAPEEVVGGLRSHGVRVGVLDCYSTIADLVGHRITGRPDLVIGMLPGRGPALAAVRTAQRLDAPLLVLVNHDGPASWGESSTLRRAARVVITGERLRARVRGCGVEPGRIHVWHSFTSAAMGALEQLAEHTIAQHRRTVAAPGAPGYVSDQDS